MGVEFIRNELQEGDRTMKPTATRPQRRLHHGLLVFFAVVWSGLAASLASGDDEQQPVLPRIQVAPDDRTFQTEAAKPFVPLGVNYYRPGTGWAPQLWKQFDSEATRNDLARMKELGVNCVRVFLSYGSFFTEPDTLNEAGLARFDELLRMAEEAGIYVHPTGPDHWEGVPDWAAKDRVADERVLLALENFWRLFAGRYQDRPVIFAYDLLNEPMVPWDTPAMRVKWNRWLESRYGSKERLAEAWGVPVPELRWGEAIPPAPQPPSDDRRLLDYQHFREWVADEWTRRQAAAIKSADPDALVTVGLIQWSVPALLPSIQHYSAFRPERLARFLDFLEIHFYPLATGFFTYSEEDERRNLAYLESVVREVAMAHRPVVIAEFGWYGGGKLTINEGRHPAASEEQQARWCRQAVKTTKGLATGWLNWGFYDHPEARDVSQLTGLLTVDGKAKAWADEFRDLAKSLADEKIEPSQLIGRPELDWDRAIIDSGAARQFREDYLRAFEEERHRK